MNIVVDPPKAPVKPPTRAARCRDWLCEMLPDANRKGGDRATLAALRRASRPLDAAICPATITLHRILGGSNYPDGMLRTGAVAAVLSHVRADAHRASVATQLGRVTDGRRPMSELRFRHLLTEVHDPKRAMTALRRAVHLLDGEVNIEDLASSMLIWLERDAPFPNAKQRSDERLLRWSYDYYGAESEGASADTDTSA
ncbi:type I-E CRISPR-associated protein Cse2/CasB [Belnapia sp. T18]|uniref:Type I-E CRISPR-associated protein Cse2/CasB n=1 Tax=Belnapia arida TaxID=2804533 RepID=A0ABS1UCL6_9PROT|nr:type I-E CRISPR-associated protein Cse2/CasB [Belnapia arida]MBL6082428.1 type I-E CRISPR-associated protein Cse2/CasB [Belnapia arida]